MLLTRLHRLSAGSFLPDVFGRSEVFQPLLHFVETPGFAGARGAIESFPVQDIYGQEDLSSEFPLSAIMDRGIETPDFKTGIVFFLRHDPVRNLFKVFIYPYAFHTVRVGGVLRLGSGKL
jgi:hypothetical protein